MLADVGGPYIIAPVSGTLRRGGHVIGSYVLSVQDDLGYVKLETRYIGLPLLLRGASGRIPVEGVIPAAGIPDSGTLTYHGARVQAVSFNAKAFPHGPLRVTLLVPVPSGSQGCGAIRLQETGRIVQTMWRRFQSVGGFAGGVREIRGGPHGGRSCMCARAPTRSRARRARARPSCPRREPSPTAARPTVSPPSPCRAAAAGRSRPRALRHLVGPGSARARAH